MTDRPSTPSGEVPVLSNAIEQYRNKWIGDHEESLADLNALIAIAAMNTRPSTPSGESVVSTDALIEALREPSNELISVFWQNMPSPIDIDYEDKDAARQSIRAVLEQALANLKDRVKK